jgi:acyl-CoA synthetase (NDP forming)
VVGATPNQAKVGNAILKNLQNTYRDAIYPVNPRVSLIVDATIIIKPS